MDQNAQMKNNVTIHVRQDSDNDLEQLFNSALNPPRDGSAKPVPLRHRKLPPSFFKPPPSGAVGLYNPGSPMMGGEGLTIAHSRAHSSPASLGQMMAVQHANSNSNNNMLRARAPVLLVCQLTCPLSIQGHNHMIL